MLNDTDNNEHCNYEIVEKVRLIETHCNLLHVIVLNNNMIMMHCITSNDELSLSKIKND